MCYGEILSSKIKHCKLSYKNENYNRFVYKSNYRIDRQELLDINATIIEQIELVIKAWDTLDDLPLIPRLLNLISWSKNEYSIESIEKLSSLKQFLTGLLDHLPTGIVIV